MTSLRRWTSRFGRRRRRHGGGSRSACKQDQYRLWAGVPAATQAARSQNQHLALAGLEVRVDGRSYAERGIDIVPTTHIGVAAKAMQRKGSEDGRGIDLERLAQHEAKRVVNARRIEARPETVLDMVTAEKSVFDVRDIAKLIIDVDGAASQAAPARVSPAKPCISMSAGRPVRRVPQKLNAQ
jgi:ATP-dependent exoDNAse (exonuclease V) alpha subunit